MQARLHISLALSLIFSFTMASCAPTADGPGSTLDGGPLCSSGSHPEGNSCVDNEEECAISNGLGRRTWNAGSWGPCEVVQCDADHHLENDACLSNERACSLENGEGTELWDGDWGPCTPRQCALGFHIDNGRCENDIRLCEVMNGEGEQVWQGTDWSDCSVVICYAGHHVEEGACLENERACMVDGGTGTQSWTDASWGQCNALCGNGVTQSDEMCDEGEENGISGCNANCQIEACGTESEYLALLTHGWRVCLSARVDETERPHLLSRIEEDMAFIREILPASASRELRSVTLWVERDVPNQAFPGAVFHPSAQWLINNGYPEEWAGDIQIGNATNYLSWTSHQPAMLLHELAHAWDYQRHQFTHPAVLAAYESAMSAGLYDRVRYYNGSQLPAYARTSAVEYFAELSEAFFWNENDYFPFTAAELLEYDPQGYEAVRDAWELP